MLFLGLKVLHIVGVIAWMAGLLYLYRLFVYHRHEAETAGEAVFFARLQIMERRLWRAITVPAAYVAVGSGLGLLALRACFYLSSGWMSLKLLLVAVLLGVHLYAGVLRKRFAAGPPFPWSARKLRYWNEVPTLLMIGIVTLVVVQPSWWRWYACQALGS